MRAKLMQQYRFMTLLVMLLAMMVLSPLTLLIQTRAFPVLAPLLTMLLFSGLLLSAVWAVARQRWMFILAGSLTVLEIVMHGINLGIDSKWLMMLQHSLGVGLLALTLALLLRELFLSRSVTFECIAASLCGYLLLGVFWSKIFLMLETVEPHSFSRALSDIAVVGSESARPLHSKDEMATALYFSYVTLTTLGYGDITPTSVPARMLCTVEAITGQLYLAVLVATLVGLHIADKTRREPPRSVPPS